MQQENAYLHIELKGDIFKKINDQYNYELELMEQIHMPYSEMGNIYKDVFQCNEKIKLLSAECYGCWAIDDNHIDIEWDIDGCIVEFYYEQFWDIMNLTIGLDKCENALKEIVRAFELYYKKSFTYQFNYETHTFSGYDGKMCEFKQYRLIIEDKS